MTTATLTQSTPTVACLNPVRILQPEGIFDGRQGADISATVETLIQAQAQAIVIDFTHTAFVDSSGLGVLLSILESTCRARIPLYLCGLNAQCLMIFELTRADAFFEICPDVAAVPHATGDLPA